MTITEYLTEVLGLKHFYGSVPPATQGFQIWNEQGYTDYQQLHDLTQVLFFHRVHDDSIFSAAPLEMFQKMASAMKLEETDFQLFETNGSLFDVTKNLLKHDFSKPLVWFDGEGKGDVPDLPFPVYVVASPVLMSKKPALKKEAWETLQKVMANRAKK